MKKAVRAGGIGAPERQTDQQGAEQNAPDVVPVEKFEPPILAELVSVGPTPPTQHAEDHHDESNGVKLRDKHGSHPIAD
jgi:hypothetical protein